MLYLFALILFGNLAALAWIDFKSFRLLDVLTLPLIAIGVLQSAISGLGWTDSLIGAAVGYGSFVAIEIGFKYLRGKDGLGRGDAKLMAAGGAWCGWIGLPFIVLIASGTGLLMLLLPSMRRLAENGRIPFGPFLALGVALVWAAQHFGYAG